MSVVQLRPKELPCALSEPLANRMLTLDISKSWQTESLL